MRLLGDVTLNLKQSFLDISLLIDFDPRSSEHFLGFLIQILHHIEIPRYRSPIHPSELKTIDVSVESLRVIVSLALNPLCFPAN
jgi:hypothetical protein